MLRCPLNRTLVQRHSSRGGTRAKVARGSSGVLAGTRRGFGFAFGFAFGFGLVWGMGWDGMGWDGMV